MIFFINFSSDDNYLTPILFLIPQILLIILSSEYPQFSQYKSSAISVLVIIALVAAVVYFGPRSSSPDTRSQHTNSKDKVIKTLQHMPIEKWCHDVSKLSISELKHRLDHRSTDWRSKTTIVEKSDLITLLKSLRRSEAECSICFEPYAEDEDDIRVLEKCHHEFHLTCIDRWVYTSADKSSSITDDDAANNIISCPLCKTPI